jgi:prolyl-tRNA synthetase
MPDGKALQAGTSHELGQNFAKAYDITFSAEDQTTQHAWTTSWGVSWRLLGAVIMLHGDDRGLRIPPKLAPTQAVIVPIVKGGGDDAVMTAARALHADLRKAGFRVKLDDRDDKKPGYKFADWEMRGVPLRIELGAADLAQQAVTVVRRDKNRGEDGAKQSVALTELAGTIPGLLDAIQANLFEQARAFLQTHTVTAGEQAEFLRLCSERAGMIDIAWCNRAECEAHVKATTGATTRNLRPLIGDPATTRCVACGEPARVQAYFAQSY